MAEDLTRQVRQHLEIEKSFGVIEVPSAAPSAVVAAGPELDAAGKATALERLRKDMTRCSHCLIGAPTKVVFGTGSPSARLMFVGEAPGFEEDKQGEPFVGPAGQLLTKIIEAMKLKRDDVYIANCLKCRPPANRNPLPTEIAECSPILEQQIDIIRPKVICALGKFAAQTLLKTEEPISHLRGRYFEYRGIKLMPTFHPAYLLRNPEDKKLVWADMQIVMKDLATA